MPGPVPGILLRCQRPRSGLGLHQPGWFGLRW